MTVKINKLLCKLCKKSYAATDDQKQLVNKLLQFEDQFKKASTHIHQVSNLRDSDKQKQILNSFQELMNHTNTCAKQYINSIKGLNSENIQQAEMESTEENYKCILYLEAIQSFYQTYIQDFNSLSKYYLRDLFLQNNQSKQMQGAAETAQKQLLIQNQQDLNKIQDLTKLNEKYLDQLQHANQRLEQFKNQILQKINIIKILQANLKQSNQKVVKKSNQVLKLQQKVKEHELKQKITIKRFQETLKKQYTIIQDLQNKLNKCEQTLIIKNTQVSKLQHMISVSDLLFSNTVQQLQQFKNNQQKSIFDGQAKLKQVKIFYQSKINKLKQNINELQIQSQWRLLISVNRIKDKIESTNIETKLLDQQQILTLLEMIEKRIQFTKIQLIFVASQHKFSSQKFHNICDNKSRILLIAKCVNGKIFGGYCSPGFGEQQQNDSSFIFTITHKIDLSLKPGKKSTVLDRDYGPIFGINSDIKIRQNKVTSNYYIYNNSYEKKSDLPVPAKELLCGQRQAQLIDYQVHQIFIDQV